MAFKGETKMCKKRQLANHNCVFYFPADAPPFTDVLPIPINGGQRWAILKHKNNRTETFTQILFGSWGTKHDIVVQ